MSTHEVRTEPAPISLNHLRFLFFAEQMFKIHTQLPPDNFYNVRVNKMRARMRSEIGKFRTDPLSAEQLVTDLRAAMESLLPKERLAICLRFRLDEETTEEGVRSQADVGKLMQPNAVSRERARVLLAYGMSGLKHGQKGTGYGGVFGNYVGSDD